MLTKSRMPLIVAVLLGIVGISTVGIGTGRSFAQVRRYQPSRPTTSSYLNLTRLNAGGIPNYYSLVRPQQQQRALNLREQALRRQQAGSLQRLQNDVQLGLQPVVGTGKRSGFFRPSSRASFGTSRIYFQTNTVLGRQ